MSKPKHTLGPWEVINVYHEYSTVYANIVADDDGRQDHICKIEAYRKGARENITLMKAAPEMFEALEFLVKTHPLAYVDPSDLDPTTETEEGLALVQARKAIAKAKGES